MFFTVTLQPTLNGLIKLYLKIDRLAGVFSLKSCFFLKVQIANLEYSSYIPIKSHRSLWIPLFQWFFFSNKKRAIYFSTSILRISTELYGSAVYGLKVYYSSNNFSKVKYLKAISSHQLPPWNSRQELHCRPVKMLATTFHFLKRQFICPEIKSWLYLLLLLQELDISQRGRVTTCTNYQLGKMNLIHNSLWECLVSQSSDL